MNKRYLQIAFLILVSLYANPQVSAQVRPQSYDVVVYTGTASGVMAAIAAARAGSKVILLEPGSHIGGMVSGGLSHTDLGDRTVIGGLALEYNQRYADYYGKPLYFWRGAEPHVAEKIFIDWLEEEEVEVRYQYRLDSVIKTGRTITRISFDNGSSVTGKVFIDAGYEGDLMAKAKVSYTVGREGVDDYNESWAGRQPLLPNNGHQFHVAVSPFVHGEEGKLLPMINPTPMVEVGQGDQAVQSYQFRIVLTKRKDNLVPFSRPEGYDASRFELLKRYLALADDRMAAPYIIPLRINTPNQKAAVNSIGPISLNVLDGSNWPYPDGDYEVRKKIWDEHLLYTQSLMYFLATDPSVPKYIRDEINQWGLCKDEFTDTGHWPHQLYIRTGRRMLGEYIMTQTDLEKNTVAYDAIGLGSYNIDIRNVQRSWAWISKFPKLVGNTLNEGYLSVPVPVYQIPYRTLVPKYQECDNLLVPVCMSSSHVANASLRMEPQYMILGHAAGVAGGMAAKKNIAVQKINIVSLQQELLAQGQILSLENRPVGAFQTDKEIILDEDFDRFIKSEGDWQTGGHAEERYGISYLANNSGKGYIQYIPEITLSGKYEVYAWWSSHIKNATRVPVHITHSQGESTIFLNQRKDGGKWVFLGEWSFDKGNKKAITISSENANGVVVADAMRFELTGR